MVAEFLLLLILPLRNKWTKGIDVYCLGKTYFILNSPLILLYFGTYKKLDGKIGKNLPVWLKLQEGYKYIFPNKYFFCLDIEILI